MIKANRLEKMVSVLNQFIKFGIVGLSNTVISVVIYNGLVIINVNYIIAYSIAFLVSVLNAFYWNNKHVFMKKASNSKNTLIKVYISYGSTFLLGMLLLYLLVRFNISSKQMAQILILFITIPINFLLNKLWAFK